MKKLFLIPQAENRDVERILTYRSLSTKGSVFQKLNCRKFMGNDLKILAETNDLSVIKILTGMNVSEIQKHI